MPDKNKSVIDTYTRNAIILIVLSAVAIGGLISNFSFYEFVQASKHLEQENFSSHKVTLQREVSRVGELIDFERSKLQSGIRKSIKDRVNEAHAIATSLYEKYKKTKSRDEIEALIVESLRPQRFFDGRGFFYALSLDGVSKLSPITPHFEGKNILSLKTKKGDYFVKKLVDIAKSTGEGFYNHTFFKPGKEGMFDKVSFVKRFEPFDWLIGSGDYVVNVEAQIQKKILEQIGKIRFGKEGYIFVVNYDGTVMMNMGQPSIIGKNIINVTDANGVKVAEEVIRLAHDPSWDGYFEYHWQKRTTSRIAPKISFNKTVPDWRWYYGTGVYTDDINEEIEKQRDALEDKLLLHLFFIITTIVVAVCILMYLSRKRAYELNVDLDRLLEFFESLSINSDFIDVEKFEYSEFKQLARSSNMMLDNQQQYEQQRVRYEEQILQNQKMAAVNQMVGGIAHDFNNLLAAILGFGELLELKLKDDKNLKGYAHHINTAGKRGAKLTNKLLSLTRSKTAEAEQVDINSLLQDEEDLLKKSLTVKIKLKMNLEDGLWPVYVDKSDLEDVILNLCVNAMHAMREGQQDSEVIISTGHVQINEEENIIHGLASGDYVRIRIADNGIGMDSKTRERVFEPFFTTRETGHGLGLSQVYSFAKHSNGTVLVESTEGKGTLFEILLPRDLAIHDSITGNDLSKNLNTKGHETILVVDDETALRELNAEILSREGYKVLTATNGAEALTVLEQEKIDLVLSDVIMPNMDGNVLAEKIGSIYPKIIIQLVSGYVDEGDLSRDDHGLYGSLLYKPVKASDLLRRVRQLLNDRPS